jgi:type II secretory pathway pseudopilin PulG
MKFKSKWFTLIELVIVISIVWIMMMMTYTPYNSFQKKSEIKIASKWIAKTLSESRNMAIHWVNSSSWNLSIWVYFDKSNKNILKIFQYPYEYWTGSQVVVNDSLLLLKEIDIWQNIWVDKIENKTKVLFLFEAISWNWYYFDFENSKQDLVLSWNKISIDFSYKGTTSGFKKTLQYYIKTYISDY